MLREVQSLIQHGIPTIIRQRQKVIDPRNPLSSKLPLIHLTHFFRRGKEYYYCFAFPSFSHTKSKRAQTVPNPRRTRRLILKAQTTYQSSSIMATTASGDNDDLRISKQQPILASQRAKQSNTPTEANRTAKFGGYFPLGYKEGFSQWVRNGPCPSSLKLFCLWVIVGQCSSSHRGACCDVLCPTSSKTSHTRTDRYIATIFQWLYNVCVG